MRKANTEAYSLAVFYEGSNFLTMIADIIPLWNNYVQDITDSSTLALDNYSLVTFSDGTKRTVLESDTIEWEWALVNNDGTVVVLTNAFQMIPAQHKLELCNGIFRLRCTAKEPSTGKIWSRTEPTHVLFTNSEVNACPVIFTPVAGYTPTKWMENQGKLMAFGNASSYPGQYFVGGKIGDLDNNGVVNITDVLMVLSKFNS